jgi:ribosome-binding protein aMBF1 (putative translation factor)
MSKRQDYGADALEQLEKDMAKARAARDPLRVGRRLMALQIAQARYRKKLSQKELAEKTGLKQSHISSIENARGNPTLDTLLRITEALDADLMVE